MTAGRGAPGLDERDGRSTTFRYPLDVRFFEVDSLGVVFNMWYLGWCDEAMSAFLESIGYGYATLRARGLDAVLRKADLEWIESLEAFQHAEIEVRVGHVGTSSFRLDYDVLRVGSGSNDNGSNDSGENGSNDSGENQRGDNQRMQGFGQHQTRCALAAITYVCVDIASRNATPIPPDLRRALSLPPGGASADPERSI